MRVVQWGSLVVKKILFFVCFLAVVIPFTITWSTGKSEVKMDIDNASEQFDSNKIDIGNMDSVGFLPKVGNTDGSQNKNTGLKKDQKGNQSIDKLIAVINEAEQKLKSDTEDNFLEGNLILVNKWTSLPGVYVPKDMVKVVDENNNVLLRSTKSDIELKKVALEAAINMFKAADQKGIKGLTLVSGYRSYDVQNWLYNNKVKALTDKYEKELAYEKAAEIVAPPGTSEHQTGLVIDITTPELLKSGDPLSSHFGNTVQGKWVYRNSWKYGFVVRYAVDKKDITGIIYEPWHLRYVGAPHAEFMYKNNLCLEEYLDYIKDKKHIKITSENRKLYDIIYSFVPVSADTFTKLFGNQVEYDISGDGQEGYIITITKE
ncbi:MAG: zinc D-Ala-D-Ala carboxypeptidase [Clostridiales bacterium]|jgi:LAS superfamily LD-carboxypeptidase LdcB|nr:zinc D-Ala-D-Ala carboxypeptidase [Clostridiales bacterium]MDK2933924.1 zinc D-Ala-D-Ala carboxypeptidase [Clostridiales bacterium]